jgi:hypothetical protein
VGDSTALQFPAEGLAPGTYTYALAIDGGETVPAPLVVAVP